MFERAILGTPSLAFDLVGRIGRGGAAAAANSTVWQDVPVGGALAVTEPVMESFLGFTMPPEGKAVVLMAIAMAFHYFGYSLARPITVALFTSSATGYAGIPAAFPLAMAFVSPFSLHR